jgi:uncharacterized phage protein (TIGR01671 family)
MNRELKFRLLDIDNNKLWIDGKGWDMYSLFVSYRYQLSQPNKFKLLQYTGLKDKHGREIYEGDIVKYKWQVHEHEFEECIGEVYFDDGCFYFDRGMSFTWSEANFKRKTVEVLGNIFESPELLSLMKEIEL